MADISPIRVYVGDDWLQPVALVSPNGEVIDLSGATVGADFWPSNMTAPVDLVAAGGGVTVLQVEPALVLLTVPRTVTGVIEQQSVLQRFYPTRAAIWVVDSQNHRQTVQFIPFQPLKARDTDLPSAATVMGTITAVLSPQGPSGPPGAQGPPPTDAKIAAAVAAWFAAHPVLPPAPGSPGVLDFSDPANSGLLVALGFFGAPYAPGSIGTLDFSSPDNSGLVAALSL